MRHFLSVNDFSKSDIISVFRLTDRIKEGKEDNLLERKALTMLFEKPSTRTRLSFETAMNLLGGYALYLDVQGSQISRGETYEDTARTLSCYSDFIAARLHHHSDLLKISGASSVPVVNALTDLEHPCQVLSDLYTAIEITGGIAKKRIAFMGDLQDNVLNSLMLAATKLGADMALVGPKESKPIPYYLNIAKEQGKVEVFSDIRRGLEGANVVYTDVWVSMGEEGDKKRRMKLFAPYQLNNKVLQYANKDAIVMHCLPAHRGDEITSDVLDGKQSVVWQQAKNKKFVQAAVLVYLSLKNPQMQI